MKRILIVFNHPAPYKVALFNELTKYFDVTVIFERKSERDRNQSFYNNEKYKFNTVKIKGIPFGNMNIFSFGVKKHIKNNKYDLIIMNGYAQCAEMIAIKYLKKNNIPYVLYINGGFIKSNEMKIKQKIKTKYISGASFYLSPNKDSNKYLVYYGAKSEKIFNYPYSTIHENEILKQKPTKEEVIELKKKLDINFDKVFVSCGQMIKRKNYFNLIKEWKNFPNYLLLLIGDGKELKKYKNYIKENNIENIKMLGFLNREKIFEYYRVSNCFIFPSNEDIYGHVINEALSQGLPIISSNNVNASKTLIKEGYNGYFVSSFSSDKLKETLQKSINSNFFENCINTAKVNSLEEMTKVHYEILSKIIK